MSALTVSCLRVVYAGRRPVRAVDGVSIELQPGESLGLVGESGCGKSTLGKALLGLLPDGARMEGSVSVGDQELVGLSPRKLRRLRGKQVGLVFQEPMTRLDPLMKVSEHFEELLRTHERKLSRKERRERALEALRATGIPASRYDQYPHEFSGGMRQRIMIALTLVLRPAVVVADEPTTALDVLVEAQILALLAELRRQSGTALLLITHNLGIVAEACDRVAVMYAGRIMEEGPSQQVFREPAHPYTRELMRSTISLSTTELHSIPGSPPDLSEPIPGCPFAARCPDAMRACPVRNPGEVRTAGGQRVSCWLHRLHDLSGAEREPLPRQELAVADEA
ncbi:peptide/nickel transport system ATP-binding protein [Motilibacter rhizosphaerae]|uniref:Peptide/nickel transport system ATP-binding protein n=1 Tax=Motilibacter rhizosphaerae TaxID=598652 RepID=A0A4Q7NW24_9ACTN|nr:ABC transporter ATP-binding protein [Motilibacter rhizosphaerae]RZS91486.1 peptide/nickel transport system ATP-binding protein [Motilibacter rhizosphaerae]